MTCILIRFLRACVDPECLIVLGAEDAALACQGHQLGDAPRLAVAVMVEFELRDRVPAVLVTEGVVEGSLLWSSSPKEAVGTMSERSHDVEPFPAVLLSEAVAVEVNRLVLTTVYVPGPGLRRKRTGVAPIEGPLDPEEELDYLEELEVDLVSSEDPLLVVLVDLVVGDEGLLNPSLMVCLGAGLLAELVVRLVVAPLAESLLEPPVVVRDKRE